MELLAEDDFPGLLQLAAGLLHVAATAGGRCHGGFGGTEQELHAAVGLFVIGLGGVGAPVELQVELAVPHRDIAVPGVLLHRLVELLAELVHPAHLDPRHAGDAAHPAGGFQHIPVGAAAAVTVAHAGEKGGVQVLVVIALPHGSNLPGCGGAAAAGAVPLDEVGQHRGAVQATPVEGVVGQLVLVVPAQLGGDEGVNLALFENLRQSGGVAEHVRQPQEGALFAELPLEKPGAIEELPHKGLPRGQVAVALHPHAAARLPAALLYPALYHLVELGVILADVLILLGLGVQKQVLGIALHQPVDRGEGAGALLVGVADAPQPGVVDVGVAHHGDIDLFLHRGQGFLDEGHRLPAGAGEGLPADAAGVHQIPGLGGQVQNAGLVGAVIGQDAVGLQQAGKPIVEAVGVFVQQRQGGTGDFVLHRVGRLLVCQAGPQAELQAQLPLPGQGRLLVVLVHRLPGLPVDVEQAFKALGGAAVGGAKAETPPHAVRQAGGQFHLRAQPQPAVVALPVIPHLHLARIARRGLGAQSAAVLRHGKGLDGHQRLPALLPQAGGGPAEPLVIVKTEWHTFPLPKRIDTVFPAPSREACPSGKHGESYQHYNERKSCFQQKFFKDAGFFAKR